MNKQMQNRHDLLEWCRETANTLSEQIELLYRELNADQEEIEGDSLNRLELEEQFPLEEEEFEANAIEQELEIEFNQYIDMEELNQYREDLLQWCNTLYSNWNRTKPMLSTLVDTAILEGWEGMCIGLKEKLQEDLLLEYDDYETANALYEQWEKLLEESHSYKEENNNNSI